MMMGSPCFSQSSADDLLKKLASSKDNREIILLHNALAENLFPTRVDEAIAHCYSGLKLSKTMASDSLEIVCYKCLINAYGEKPYFEDSAFTFIRPFEAVRSADKYPQLQSETYLAIATTYTQLHEYDKAIYYQQKGVEKADLTDNYVIIGTAKNALADLYRKSGHLDEALILFREVAYIGEKANDLSLVALSNRGIGVCYDLRKDYRNAEHYFFLVLGFALRGSNKRQLWSAYSNYGLVQWHLKNYSEAIHYLLLSYHLANDLHVGTIGICTMNLCAVYREKGDLDSSVYWGNIALDDGIKNNQAKALSITHGELSETYKNKGDYKTAYEHLLAHDSLEIIQKDMEHDKTVSELETKFKTKENQAQVNLLSKENELKKLLLKKQAGDLKIAEQNDEQQKKTALLNALEIQNKKTQLENLNKLQQLKEREKFSEINLLNKEKKLQETEAGRQKIQKNLFILGFLFVSIIGVFAFYRYRQNTKQKQEAERARISRDLHDDVGATLGSISIYSEVAKNKSVNNSEITDVLTKIGDSSRDMLEKMNDIVWAVNPKNDTAEQLIQRMKNFAAVMLTPKNILFDFETRSIILDELKLDMQKRKNIFLIYKEAIHNIIKYADAKQVNLKMNIQSSKLAIEITDDGVGFNSLSFGKGRGAPYNGNGIRNMNDRATEIRGLFKITSETNKGTQIHLSIPV